MPEIYTFNNNKHNWKINASEITSISGDDLKIYAKNNQNIVFKTSGAVNIENHLDILNNLRSQKDINIVKDLILDTSNVSIKTPNSNYVIKCGEDLLTKYIEFSNQWIDLSDSGYKIDVTPETKNSKILLNFNLTYNVSEINNQKLSFRLKRFKSSTGQTDIVVTDNMLGTEFAFGVQDIFKFVYLDEPSIDTSITYYLEVNCNKLGSDLSDVAILGYNDNKYNNIIAYQIYIPDISNSITKAPKKLISVSFEDIINNKGLFNDIDANKVSIDNCLNITGTTSINNMIDISSYIYSKSGTIEISGNISTKDDKIYDLGSSDKKFKHVFLSTESLYFRDKKVSIDVCGNMKISDNSSNENLYINFDSLISDASFGNIELSDNLIMSNNTNINFLSNIDLSVNEQLNILNDISINTTLISSGNNIDTIVYNNDLSINNINSNNLIINVSNIDISSIVTHDFINKNDISFNTVTIKQKLDISSLKITDLRNNQTITSEAITNLFTDLSVNTKIDISQGSIILNNNNINISNLKTTNLTSNDSSINNLFSNASLDKANINNLIIKNKLNVKDVSCNEIETSGNFYVNKMELENNKLTIEASNVVIEGSLIVDGTNITIESNNIEISGNKIKLASNDNDNTRLNGSGIEISNNIASIKYKNTNDEIEISSNLFEVLKDISAKNITIENDLNYLGTNLPNITNEIIGTSTDLSLTLSELDNLPGNVLNLSNTDNLEKQKIFNTFDVSNLTNSLNINDISFIKNGDTYTISYNDLSLSDITRIFSSITTTGISLDIINNKVVLSLPQSLEPNTNIEFSGVTISNSLYINQQDVSIARVSDLQTKLQNMKNESSTSSSSSQITSSSKFSVDLNFNNNDNKNKIITYEKNKNKYIKTSDIVVSSKNNLHQNMYLYLNPFKATLQQRILSNNNDYSNNSYTNLLYSVDGINWLNNVAGHSNANSELDPLYHSIIKYEKNVWIYFNSISGDTNANHSIYNFSYDGKYWYTINDTTGLDGLSPTLLEKSNDRNNLKYTDADLANKERQTLTTGQDVSNIKYPVISSNNDIIVMGFSSSYTPTPTPTVENPYFTSASTITTNSDWPNDVGFSVTSRNQYWEGSAAWKVFHDGTRTENYLSTNEEGDEWIQITYPREVYLQSYTFRTAMDGTGHNPTSWKMQGSNNGSDWDDLEDIQNAPPWTTTGMTQNATISATAKYSSFRLYMPKTYGHRSLNRIQMFTSDPLKSNIKLFYSYNAKNWYNAKISFDSVSTNAIMSNILWDGNKFIANIREDTNIKYGYSYSGKEWYMNNDVSMNIGSTALSTLQNNRNIDTILSSGRIISKKEFVEGGGGGGGEGGGGTSLLTNLNFSSINSHYSVVNNDIFMSGSYMSVYGSYEGKYFYINNKNTNIFETYNINSNGYLGNNLDTQITSTTNPFEYMRFGPYVNKLGSMLIIDNGSYNAAGTQQLFIKVNPNSSDTWVSKNTNLELRESSAERAQWNTVYTMNLFITDYGYLNSESYEFLIVATTPAYRIYKVKYSDGSKEELLEISANNISSILPNNSQDEGPGGGQKSVNTTLYKFQINGYYDSYSNPGAFRLFIQNNYLILIKVSPGDNKTLSMYSYYIDKSETNPFQNMVGTDWKRYTVQPSGANYIPSINARTDDWWNYDGGIRYIDTTITGNYFCFNYYDSWQPGQLNRRYSYVYIFKLQEDAGENSFPYTAVYNSSNDDYARIYEDIVGFVGLSIIEYKESVLLTFNYGNQGAGNDWSWFGGGNDDQDIVAGILIFDKDTNNNLIFSSKTTYKNNVISQFVFPIATCKYIVGFDYNQNTPNKKYNVILLNTTEGSSSSSSSGSASGSSETTCYDKLIYSDDGYNWNEAIIKDKDDNEILDGSYGKIDNVAYNGNILVGTIGSSSSLDSLKKIIYSYTGSEWNMLDKTLLSAKSVPSNLEWTGSMFTMAGRNFAYSYNGLQWFNNKDVISSNIKGNYGTLEYNNMVTQDIKSNINSKSSNNEIRISANQIIGIGQGSKFYYSNDIFNWYNLNGEDTSLNYLTNFKLNNINRNNISSNKVFDVSSGVYDTIIDNKLGLSYNGKMWLACGNTNDLSNTLAYSKDGYNWFNIGNNVSNILTRGYDITNNKKTWVAVGKKGTNGSIIYSNDGFSWCDVSNLSIQNSQQICSVVYGNDMFVAGSKGDKFILYYSRDAKNWTGIDISNIEGNSNIDSNYNSCTNLIYNGTSFVGLLQPENKSETMDKLTIIYSSDGYNWNAIVNTSIIAKDSSVNSLYSMDHNKDRVMVVGYRNILYSDNLIDWYRSTKLPYLDVYKRYTDIIWTGELWLLSTNYEINNHKKLYYSKNGKVWNQINNGSVLQDTFIMKIGCTKSQSNIYLQHPIIAGCDGSTNTLIYSDDLYKWKGLGRVFSKECNDIKWNGNNWVAIGKNNLNNSEIKWSKDGIKWTNIIFPNDISGLNSIVCGKDSSLNDIMVIAGNKNNDLIILKSKDNGIKWNTKTVASNIPVTNDLKIIYNNYNYILCADKIYKSSDLNNWESILDSSGRNILTTGNNLLFINNSTNKLTKLDLYNYTNSYSSQEILNTNNVECFGYNGEMFIVVENDNTNINIKSYRDMSSQYISNNDISGEASCIEWTGKKWLIGLANETQFKYYDININANIHKRSEKFICSYDGINWEYLETANTFCSKSIKCIATNPLIGTECYDSQIVINNNLNSNNLEIINNNKLFNSNNVSLNIS